MPQIKFSLVVKERSLDVALQNVGAIGAVGVYLLLFEHAFDIIQSEAHLDTVTSVAVFPRFDNPSVLFLVFVTFIWVAFVDLFVAFVVVP